MDGNNHIYITYVPKLVILNQVSLILLESTEVLDIIHIGRSQPMGLKLVTSFSP